MPNSRPVMASALCALLVAAVAGCDRSPRLASAAPVLGEVVEIASPAGAGAGQPFLAPAAGGGLLMSWTEPVADDTFAVRFARWHGAAWSAPATVVTGSDFFVNWADFPSIIELADGRLVAHWLARSGEGRFAYDVRLAWSSDAGASWSQPLTPHDDGTQTEHGFVSLFPVDDGFGVVWLDGRNFEGAGTGSGAEMTLRYTTVLANGARTDEQVLDARTCECCQTGAAVAADGPVVVYRDRTSEEVRDIAITRRVDGRWAEPALVHADGWVYPGCPVNGPAVAARSNDVVVAWFTAADDTPRVRVAFSADGGASFGAPIGVDDGSPAGRVDVLLLDDGAALVSWLERDAPPGEGASVRVRAIRASGERSPTLVVAEASAARAGGFPRMARADDSILFAWTEPGEPSRVRVALAPMRRVDLVD